MGCRGAGERSIRESWFRHGPGSKPELLGQEPFVEMEWEVALDLVPAELDRVRTEHGNGRSRPEVR